MGKGGSVEVYVPADGGEGTRPMNNVSLELTHLAKLAAAAAKANPQKRFYSLFRLVCNRAMLGFALDTIKSNKGFNTPGTDGVQGKDLDAVCLDKLAVKLRDGTYQPIAVRRVFIPKRNGKLRALGIPSAEDKVVQSAI